MMHRKLSQQENPTIEYVHYKELHPAQQRYSILNMKEKANKAITMGHAVWNDEDKSWTYAFNDGDSVLPRDRGLPVVRTRFGYVLLDGHHDVLSSLYLQAEMIPVRVMEDASHLTVDEFWQEAEQRGWSYLYTTTGEKVDPPKSFQDLVDDPNRYFAALVARKYKTDNDGDYTSKGAEYPLWIKVNKDIPFIEFKIANALYEAGFVYQPERMGIPPASTISEYARKILIDAKIEGLRMVPERIHYEKIKIHEDYVRIKVPGPDIILNALHSKVNKDDVIRQLQDYIHEVESHHHPYGSINYANNFWFFKGSRAINRKANYLLAKELLLVLESGEHPENVFDEKSLNNRRAAIIRIHHLDERQEYHDRGMKSGHIDAIAKMIRST